MNVCVLINLKGHEFRINVKCIDNDEINRRVSILLIAKLCVSCYKWNYVCGRIY